MDEQGRPKRNARDVMRQVAAWAKAGEAIPCRPDVTDAANYRFGYHGPKFRRSPDWLDVLVAAIVTLGLLALEAMTRP